MSRNTSPRSFASDEEVIEMYWQRDPDAMQATDHKYGKLLQNTAYNILSDLQDGEECQNDVYLRVWNAIPSTRPTEFFAFIMQIMRRIAFNFYMEVTLERINDILTPKIQGCVFRTYF